jgi:broad specificity phosphatase PhoE
MIKNLYVIRHGEAEHLVEGRLTGGWTDSRLTELGKFQADITGKRIFEFLGNTEVDFYCSDLSRARQTAEIIGKHISKNPTPSMKLRELNNGDAANLTTIEADKIALSKTEPMMDWVHYPNSESWRNMQDRVFSFMNTISTVSKENVLIVTHRGIIVSMIDWWLELTEEFIEKISYDIEPCSFTHLRINKWGEKTLSKLNDTSHLYVNKFHIESLNKIL